MTTDTSDPRISIRQLTRHDYDWVAEIELTCFKDPWNTEDLDFLREPRYYGFVAEHDGIPAGYIMYSKGSRGIDVIRVATGKQFRRLGVATHLLNQAKSRLSKGRRYIVAMAHERDLATQLFLKKSGMICVSLVKDSFKDGSDEYVFEFDAREPWRSDRISVHGQGHVEQDN